MTLLHLPRSAKSVVGATLTCLSCGHQSEHEGPLGHPAALRCARCHGKVFVEEIRTATRADAPFTADGSRDSRVPRTRTRRRTF